jgi:dipeptidyl-peptidase-4
MRLVFYLAALPLLTAVCLGRAEASGEATAPLTFDQIFAANRPGEWPKQIAWSPDGTRLGYLLPGEEGGQALWELAVPSGEARLLLTSKDLPATGGEEVGIDRYHFSPTGGAVLVAAGGELFLAPGPGASPRRLTETPEQEDGESFSPDGSRVAFTRGPDLYVLDLDRGKERPLTRDGKANLVLNGQTDWVYGEEIWDREPEGYWWSPDGERIAFYRFDEAGVESYPLVDFLPTYPRVTWQRYPKAGSANPRVSIGIVEVAKGRTVWLDTGGAPDDYLARVHWHPSGRELAVERLNRDQTRLEVLLCDAVRGRSSPLLIEEHPTWVNLSRDFRFLADGRFLWTSERTGFRHIYLYTPDGKLIQPLTQGPWSVTSIDGVDDREGWVIFSAHSAAGSGAAHRRVMRVALAGGDPLPLSPEPGWNQALVAPRGGHWLYSEADADHPPRRFVVRPDGSRVKELPAGPAGAFDPGDLPRWESLAIWGLDGRKLPARILKPPGFDPAKRHPALMYHYGGPGSQVIVQRWDGRTRDLWHRMMAQRGYFVLSVDNVTTAFFGKEGEDKVHRDFGRFNLDAQLAGVEYLKTLPFIDPARIGLWGWSGGGSNTLTAMLSAPGVWRAAVAGAPVTDWKLYDSIWTERYLDTPQANPQGYAASSPITLAAKLRDPLLLIHGLADDNVHPQNSLAMARAFTAAGVPFEEAYYHGQTHAMKGQPERHMYERMTAFFDRHLKP